MTSERQGFLGRLIGKLRRSWIAIEQDSRIRSLSAQLSSGQTEEGQNPVIFFNASTRLTGVSQNAAFALIASWGLAAEGIPVMYFACRSGMSQCVLGSVVGDLLDPMPCRACLQETERLTGAGPTAWFDYRAEPELVRLLEGSGLDRLKEISYQGLPLGELVLPSVRWVLRRHDLERDPQSSLVFRRMIESAHQVAQGFKELLDRVDPRAVVVFNGLQYPEAVVKAICRERGIRVVTHEVGFQPLSAFFSHGEATAYPIHIPDSFSLTEEQERQLDAYLENRFQGEFTMAGIRFWPEMQETDPELEHRMDEFDQTVVVFTNVSFDTSQAHAHAIFDSMFAWLEEVLETAREYPETLFIIRAHPDELRPGKESRDTVAEWIDRFSKPQDHNLIFVGSNQPFSSYTLIRQAKFSLVYNSSIGLEASILGKPVLCGGKARYTRYPIVYCPESLQDFRARLREMLEAETLDVPTGFQINARRFLYYQLERVSLPFDDFVEDHPLPGYVQIKDLSTEDLKPEHSQTLKVLKRGILNGEEFVLPG